MREINRIFQGEYSRIRLSGQEKMPPEERRQRGEGGRHESKTDHNLCSKQQGDRGRDGASGYT